MRNKYYYNCETMEILTENELRKYFFETIHTEDLEEYQGVTPEENFQDWKDSTLTGMGSNTTELELTEQQYEIIKACIEDRLYDYIASNYWKMSTDLLKTLLLETLWCMHQNDCSDANLLDELIDRL